MPHLVRRNPANRSQVEKLLPNLYAVGVMPTDKPFNNPFGDSLRGLRDHLPEQAMPPEAVAQPEGQVSREVGKKLQEESQEQAEKKRREEKEDSDLWDEVVNILEINSKKSTKRYWGAYRAIRESREYDTSFNIDRWISGWIQYVKDPAQARRLREISELLLRRAYTSHAVLSLKAATPEGMRYGRASREERIQEAREYAKKIGASIEQIMSEHDIHLDL